MSRYEGYEAALVDVKARRTADIPNLMAVEDDYALVIGDPDATAYVVHGTVAGLAQFATAVTRAVTMVALGAEGRMPQLERPPRSRS